MFSVREKRFISLSSCLKYADGKHVGLKTLNSIECEDIKVHFSNFQMGLDFGLVDHTFWAMLVPRDVLQIRLQTKHTKGWLLGFSKALAWANVLPKQPIFYLSMILLG